MRIPNKRLLEFLDKAFAMPLSGMRRIIREFHSEMEAGLAGKASSLKMIPAYVDRPTGKEKGVFMALDVGGTNFRILELELDGNGSARILKACNFALPKNCVTGTDGELFGFIAERIRGFLTGEKNRWLSLGFTFSFPMEQTGLASGTLLRWTKGFKTRGVIGKDVVSLLKEFLARVGVLHIHVAALANDTVGTLVAKSYEARDCDIAVILGTGTNACYSEDLHAIKKWKGPATRSGRMIINIEWGNFNKLPLAPYDKILDKASDRPGHQILEKMVSGMYLGEVTRLILKDLKSRKMLFSGRRRTLFAKRYGFKTEYMSAIEGDRSKGLSKVASLLNKALGIKGSTPEERRLIKKVCAMVSRRGARISAAATAGVITKIDPRISKRHTVAIDGSVYEKHPTFSKEMRKALGEALGKSASRIRLSLAKDGSGKGAAIIAAVAVS